MDSFGDLWARAALTSLSFFWKALWAFVLGYTISSMIQVFVTRERMQRAMGEAGPRSVALGTAFGFVSSSCSFAALATTRALFRKGAGLVPSLAFLLASTNLVIELGVVIAVFLTWQFVVGEYVGGVLLILAMWGLVALTRPTGLLERAREDADGEAEGGAPPTGSWGERLRSAEAWDRVARQYLMEWGMVLKDVTLGFAAAGAIAVFVPREFFGTLFPGGAAEGAGFGAVLTDAVVGPLAAFCTFIGSMGNVPLAGLLYHNDVSFAGVMAFLFSDLVVFPVLRIQVGYYGWRLALYIAGVFLVSLVAVSVALHYAFDALGMLPSGGSVRVGERTPEFPVDHTFWLDLAGLTLTALFVWRARAAARREASDGDATPSDADDPGGGGAHDGHDRSATGGGVTLDGVLTAVAWVAAAWLAAGAGIAAFG